MTLYVYCYREVYSGGGRHHTEHVHFDSENVGDPKDVHHIIPPCHRIGYSIEEGSDEYSLETIETLETRFEVLRRRGGIIGIAESGMLRHESYGGFSVM